MASSYARWIGHWERRLASRDKERTIRPFEWGLEWLEAEGFDGDPRRYVRDYTRRAAACSQEFFSYRSPSDFVFDGHTLRFTSPLVSPYPENNRVHADLFPAKRAGNRAVVVLPQWNADASGHAALCRLLTRFGLTALRMSLAYHDRRMPAGLQRADYHVSSSVGRTIHASRQSVIDARACVD